VKVPEHRVTDARLLRRTRELFELLGCLTTKFQPLTIVSRFVGQFLSSCLNGEVALSLSDLRLPRIPILSDQIAREAREVEVDQLAGRT